MPDRVKMPRNAPRFYRGVYQQVCEHQQPESIAGTFMRAKQKHIHKMGSGGNQLITKLCSYLSLYSNNSLLHGLYVDWLEVHDEINRLAFGIQGDRCDIAHATSAGHRVAQKLKNGECFDLLAQLHEEGDIEMWKAYVEEPCHINGYENVDTAFIEQCREAVRNEPKNGNKNTRKLSMDEFDSIDVLNNF